MVFSHSLTASELNTHPGLSDAVQCLDRLVDGSVSPLRTAVTRFGYERHLLHTDPDKRFVILNLIWPPGAGTPFHQHLVWCAFTLVSGALTEMVAKKNHSRFGERELVTGTINFDAGGDTYTHRLVNRSQQVASSVHVYGVEPEHYETGINRFIDDLMTA